MRNISRSLMRWDFPIAQRKVPTPDDSLDPEAIRLRPGLHGEFSNRNPTPFRWKFEQAELMALLAKIRIYEQAWEQWSTGQPIPPARGEIRGWEETCLSGRPGGFDAATLRLGGAREDRGCMASGLWLWGKPQ